jgi:uncharacterized membrane protein
MAKATCSVCGTQVDTRHLVNPQKLDEELVSLIRAENPSWEGKRGVCDKCREKFRAKKFLVYLEAESRKLSEMEKELVTKIARRGRISHAVDKEFEEALTFGQRVADKVAQFGGSWTFIFIFGGVLLVWVALNTIPLILNKPFDPFPYILLNLVLSMLAAIQAPVIMMSQNRQAAHDRLEARHDYEVNLMAEIEIRDLHDKLDSLRFKQWHELWQMLQRQIDTLDLLQKTLCPAAPNAPSAPAAEGESAPESGV